MNDRHDELVRRAAELKAESAALKVVAKSWLTRPPHPARSCGASWPRHPG